MERVSDYIIERLEQAQVNTVFLITGRGILYLTDAVAKNRNIEGVSVYHEQGASYAAMSYAAAKDGVGACLVSTGCAAANAVTAALCAWQDNLPCVFISGQHMLNETTRHTGVPIRTYGSQEADIISIVKPITKYAVMLTDPEDVAVEMDKAFFLANSGRKGPVWIDVPLDVQNMRVEPGALKRWTCPNDCEIYPDIEAAVQDVAAELQAAERPILFVGGGVRSAEAQQEVQKFAERNNIPVVFSTSAADAYGSGNRLSIGAVGSLGGSRAGNFAVQNATYLLVVGSKLCSQTIGAEAKDFARAAKIVVVDIDRNEHTKRGAKIDRVIAADARQFMKQLNACTLNIRCRDWTEKCLHWKETFSVAQEEFVKTRSGSEKVDLYHFADVLSDKLPENATVITDAGFEELIIPSAIRYRANQRCLFPAAQGAMGYAVPAIIGAHYAGRKHIITVVGDGSIMMNIQELQAIRWHHIPTKIFVINNNMYAVIRKRQKDLFRTRTIGNDPSDGLGAPDFKKIAEAFGIPYRLIRNTDELDQTLDGVLTMDGPCICEVMCVEEQPYLHSSFATAQNRKLVKRPIEDQSPFMDRDKFLAEMIVEPVGQ